MSVTLRSTDQMRPKSGSEVFDQVIEDDRRVEVMEVGEADPVLQRSRPIPGSPAEADVVDGFAVHREKHDLHFLVLPVRRAHGFGKSAIDADQSFDPELAPPFVDDEEVPAAREKRSHRVSVPE